MSTLFRQCTCATRSGGYFEADITGFSLAVPPAVWQGLSRRNSAVKKAACR
jgi:hypothetical protein